MTTKRTARTEDAPAYTVSTSTVSDDRIIARALVILNKRMRQPGASIDSPSATRDYLRVALADRPHEVFCVLFLDAQHRVIAFNEMFRGTLTQTSVYPREVVKAALAHNAAAVILSHNHPSGNAMPSEADKLLTETLTSALSLIDVRVLDHIIVAGNKTTSFAETGLL